MFSCPFEMKSHLKSSKRPVLPKKGWLNIFLGILCIFGSFCITLLEPELLQSITMDLQTNSCVSLCPAQCMWERKAQKSKLISWLLLWCSTSFTLRRVFFPWGAHFRSMEEKSSLKNTGKNAQDRSKGRRRTSLLYNSIDTSAKSCWKELWGRSIWVPRPWGCPACGHFTPKSPHVPFWQH